MHAHRTVVHRCCHDIPADAPPPVREARPCWDVRLGHRCPRVNKIRLKYALSFVLGSNGKLGALGQAVTNPLNFGKNRGNMASRMSAPLIIAMVESRESLESPMPTREFKGARFVHMRIAD